MIHKLTARALIRDYEDGILHENETNHEVCSFHSKNHYVLFMAGSLEIDLSMDVESKASWMEVHTVLGACIVRSGVLYNFLRTLW